MTGEEPWETQLCAPAVAQDDGSDIPLSEWTLRHACLQVAKWHKEGAGPIRVSVKVSIKELHNDRYADAVRSALHESGLDARFLEIEVQQAAAVNNFEGVAGALRKLKRLEIRLSLGSFGLGRCSLAVLKQLGCNRLKIRPWFVGAGGEQNRMPVACAIVELALALDLAVIAEGVDSKQAAELLAGIGCHEAQGPYFGVPIHSSAFAARLRPVSYNIRP